METNTLYLTLSEYNKAGFELNKGNEIVHGPSNTRYTFLEESKYEVKLESKKSDKVFWKPKHEMLVAIPVADIMVRASENASKAKQRSFACVIFCVLTIIFLVLTR